MKSDNAPRRKCRKPSAPRHKEAIFYIEARCGRRRIAQARLRVVYEGLLNVGGLVADGWYAIRHKAASRLEGGRILRLRK